MTTSLFILAFRISVGLPEVIIFQIGAIVLGFCIHLYITTRKNASAALQQPAASLNEADDWKLKYFNDMDIHEKREAAMQHDLRASKEKEKYLSLELEALHRENKLILIEQENIKQPGKETSDYLDQLKSAQQDLSKHNQHIFKLLEQIEQLKETERKHREAVHANEILNKQMLDLRALVIEKENEIKHARQQQRLGDEMRSRLDKAYTDYNALVDKMQQLESHISQPHNGTGYDELQETYFKITKEFDELKLKQISLLEENQRLSRVLADTEDKLRESNFQRQQMLKKVSFLEELNHDLQQVAEHNNKLQSQMRRIGEIELLLMKATRDNNDQQQNPL